MTAIPGTTTPSTAFVLGGGGHLGGYEAGMLRALFEAGIVPDLVVGTSVGSIHGAIAAADPSTGACLTLADLWMEFVSQQVMHTSKVRSLTTLAHTGTHIASNEALHRLLVDHLGEDRRIEDLPVRFECVAASIERSAAQYFGAGPLVPAVMASCAVPVLWPAIEIDGQHYLDGGVVESIPVHRAYDLGATEVYVLHVGRIERPLNLPTTPWEVASVCFEISRRHGFADAVASVPEGVTVHVLPTGEDPTAPHHKEHVESMGAELDSVRRRIESGYQATRAYLAAPRPLTAQGSETRRLKASVAAAGS